MSNTIGSKIKIALAGNPNAGKTTIFNKLVGAHQHVGNYPGVTVEKVQGTCHHGSLEMLFTDLPGTYSLNATSPEEAVSRDFIYHETPDIIVDVVDASNLERNLYLTYQLLETGIPVVIVLNLSDKAQEQGITIDDAQLSKALNNSPVIRTVGNKGIGLDKILDAIAKMDITPKETGFRLDYGPEYEQEMTKISSQLQTSKAVKANSRVSERWLLVSLLERDPLSSKWIPDPKAQELAASFAHQKEAQTGKSVSTIFSEIRYQNILELCKNIVKTTKTNASTRASKIDAVLLHRFWGLPIFLVLMYILFQVTFTLGDPLMGWIEDGFDWLKDFVATLWPEGSESFLKSLIVDGIIGGVGGVIVFLPNIVLLFTGIAILEDSGYMARAACLLDNAMSKFGLRGKSFIPLLVGFGCNVPGVIATRIIPNRADRFLTILILPLFSCGARLPIYALIIPAFFPEQWRGFVLFMMYFTGVFIAAIAAKILSVTVFKGQSEPFVIELPDYQMPTLLGLWIIIWRRSWLYLKKVGTIILGVSIILWAMAVWPGVSEETQAQYDAKTEALAAAAEAEGIDEEVTAKAEEYAEKMEALEGEEDMDEEALAKAKEELDNEYFSIPHVRAAVEMKEAQTELDNELASATLESALMGRIGKFLEPIFRPCGFDWKMDCAIIAGLAAKEVVVSQMGIIYSLGEVDEESDSLREKLQENYTPLQGLCLMLFCLLSAPCFACIATVKQEMGGWKWAIYQTIGLTVLAWSVSTLVNQVGQVILQSKNPIELLIVIGIIALALFWAIFRIADKLQGKGGCGCASCGGCCGCSGRKKD
ncbi:MAG: ferrous iron transport protein B [Verrucomicrobia bacterium]|nr:ferrous iron transport protein B [Verrucomicrobiota bacterium]